jgi:hypothetical protein
MCSTRKRILVFEKGERKYNLSNDDWEYTYEIDNERLVVSTTKSEAHLKSYTRDGSSIFESEDGQKVNITYKEEKIEIKYVYIRSRADNEPVEPEKLNAMGEKGICTRAVAYTMHSLLDHLNKKPRNGSVLIMSKMPCQAFNCYNNAFMSNGYNLIDPGGVYLKDMNNQVGKNEIVSQYFEYKRIECMKL